MTKKLKERVLTLLTSTKRPIESLYQILQTSKEGGKVQWSVILLLRGIIRTLPWTSMPSAWCTHPNHAYSPFTSSVSTLSILLTRTEGHQFIQSMPYQTKMAVWVSKNTWAFWRSTRSTRGSSSITTTWIKVDGTRSRHLTNQSPSSITRLPSKANQYS